MSGLQSTEALQALKGLDCGCRTRCLEMGMGLCEASDTHLFIHSTYAFEDFAITTSSIARFDTDYGVLK